MSYFRYRTTDLSETFLNIREIMNKNNLAYERKAKRVLNLLEDILVNNGSASVKKLKIDRDIRLDRKIIMCEKYAWTNALNTEYTFNTLTLNHFMYELKAIKAEFEKPMILEVDAGLGFLSFFMDYYNIPIVTTDQCPWLFDNKQPYVPVIKMDRQKAIYEYSPDILIAPHNQFDTYTFDDYSGKYLILLGVIPKDYENTWEIRRQIELPRFVDSTTQHATFLVRKETFTT